MKPRPYLIIPKLIQQPTWGGAYICDMKGWSNKDILRGRKIGQSYELFSGTKLLISITDTGDERFVPEIGYPDSTEIIEELFPLTEGQDYIPLSEIVGSDEMRLLIKFTQSLGNSFQLHVKQDVIDEKWKPKAESWYYFEPGYLSFGIRNGISIDEYKDTCIRIAGFMEKLSREVVAGKKSLDEARAIAKNFISANDPHRFVNLYESRKFEVIDPSLGGIHHSWEENPEKFPLGNVLYEIQDDVMDPVSTIRCFDQGKIKEDGSVRELNIEDYFKYLDTNPENNNPRMIRQRANGENVIKTSKYSMDVIKLTKSRLLDTEGKFNHLFVQDGEVEVRSGEGAIKISKGFSCFIPKLVGKYELTPLVDGSVILKTYI